jgi:ATP-dependent Clp protease ATP-binding subunit ClpA
MFERFTEQARQILVLAQEEARSLGHDYLGTEHLLLGVTRADAGLAPRLLADEGVRRDELRREIARRIGIGGFDRDALATIGIDLDRVRAAVEATFGPGALDRKRCGSIPFTPRAKRAFERALQEARALGSDYIASEHLLLALAQPGGIAADVLAERGLTHDRVERLVRDTLTAA